MKREIQRDLIDRIKDLSIDGRKELFAGISYIHNLGNHPRHEIPLVNGELKQFFERSLNDISVETGLNRHYISDLYKFVKDTKFSTTDPYKIFRLEYF